MKPPPWKPRKSINRRRPGVRRGPTGVPPDKWRNEAYLEWLREQPCALCGHSPAEPAHGPMNGAGSKGPDAEAVPLCRLHHAEMHQFGSWPSFEERHFFIRAAVASAHWARWEGEHANV
jgi:hypothetical protein